MTNPVTDFSKTLNTQLLYIKSCIERGSYRNAIDELDSIIEVFDNVVKNPIKPENVLLPLDKR